MNFDRLPSDKPAGFVVPEGTYEAIIVDPKMAQPKDATKKAYLNFKLDLYNPTSKEKVGSIFDSLFDSEASLTQYKIKRFLIALNIKLTEFELSDLSKLIAGKSMIVDVRTEKREGQPDRSIVDVLKGDIYYPLAATTTPAVAGETAGPINAADGNKVNMEDVPEVF